ncbi:UNVERIFIED_CONTAM: hypothetical protein DES50_1117 [Williamsia faeni]
MIVDYIDAHKDRFGVCGVLTEHGMQIAPSTYYARKKAGPMLADAYDAHAVYREYIRQRGVHGCARCGTRCGAAATRWAATRWPIDGICGISGAIRGKHRTVTTRRDDTAQIHPDHVKRQWNSPTSPDQ